MTEETKLGRPVHYVRIIQNGIFDGSVLPAAQVLPDAWENSCFTVEEMAAGEGVDEWEPGTCCRDLIDDILYTYTGHTWACVLADRGGKIWNDETD